MSKYAIVGISCLFPGAETPERFWDNLKAGTDSRTEGGAEVFGQEPDAKDADPRHRIYCRRGGFITDFAFDPAGYRIAPEKLGRLDRIFHWSMHTAREALRDSGHDDQSGMLARCGLILGNYSFPTSASARISVPLAQEAVLSGLRQAGLALEQADDIRLVNDADLLLENLTVSGSVPGVTATALGLGGPRYALDAACSSALYALKLGCDHLRAGQADIMLVGGVCAPEPTLIHLSFSDLHAYPTDGYSQPFDDRSGGIITGQGAGVIAIRRLADAIRDGDQIYAVVDGIGLTNNGNGRHLLAPVADAQVQSYEFAYAEAGIDPTAIDYLECHATGTPLGDETEARSVATFFGGHGKIPPLGSVKGNIGHLLTVAGLSSLLKVILALRHDYLPPTIGVSQPIRTKDGADIGDALLRAGRPWPRTEKPRIAAVSAFGFGGTNAHVVLSEAAGNEKASEEPPTAVPALDLIGLGAHFGTLDTVDAFERAVFGAAHDFGPLPERRWRGLDQTRNGTLERIAGITPETPPQGSFVPDVPIDPVDQKIPPGDLRIYNPQHALVTRVADEALRDAGYDRSPAPGQSAPAPRHIAVIIAMEIEPYTHARLTRYGMGTFLREQLAACGQLPGDEQLAALTELCRDAVVDPIGVNEVLSYIGNVMASRVSSLWNLTGPSFTVSSDSSGTAEALEVARLLLLNPGVEAVLVGAVDLAGSAERLLMHPEQAAGPGLTFGAGLRGTRIGEGAGAVVVTRAGQSASQSASPAYARLDSLVMRHTPAEDGVVPEADAATLAAAAAAALSAAGITAADVGYLEAHAGGTAIQDQAELAAMAQVYPAGQPGITGKPGAAGQPRLITALGSAKAQVGDAGCAAVMAGLIRTALCLHHGYLPGTADWPGAEQDLLPALADSALYIPQTSRPWLRSARGARRYAALNIIGGSGAHGHLVLSADTTRGRVTESDWQRADGPILLPLGAGSFDELSSAIKEHQDKLADGADPWELARQAAGQLRGRPVRLVLIGNDAAQLRQQLDLAAANLPAVYASGEEWATPAGSFCTARPIGPDGKVALVYPGAVNSYPGLGQDLFRAFPGLLDRFEDQADEPERLLRAPLLYPRSQAPVGRRELMGLETELGADIPFMLATGTSFAILYTDLMREIFGVTVSGAFGYSLGESSMLFATRCWLPRGRRDDLISNTPIFVDRLCGPRNCARDLWELPARTPDSDVWASHVVLTGAETVQAVLPRYERVFITHVNTPGELVIAGDPAQCRELIRELGCPSARSPVNVVMHCPVVNSELGGLAGLNDYPVGALDGLELLSAYDYDTISDLDRQEIARRIAQTLAATIDFPRLVHGAYDRGYRYFIEAGPSATCSRWVHDTLGDAPHVSVPVDRRGVPATKSIAQLVARLIGHGLDLDLSALLGPEPRLVSGHHRQFRVGGGEPIPARVAKAAAEISAAAPAPPALPEESPLMAADEVFTDPDAITFDGDPSTFLPWAAEDSGEGGTPAGPASPPPPPPLPPAPSPAPAPVYSGSTGASSAAADLVRDLRRQMVATHAVVMEAQRVLQSAALSRSERLLVIEQPVPPAPVRETTVISEIPELTVVLPPAPPEPAPAIAPPKAPGVIFDEADLLEFATGSVAKVFGPEFEVVDGYACRVRLPAPPYHFVTRVTAISGKPGVLEPAKITTEYDVPADAWYAVDGGVPPAVTVEAGQCDLLLVSYLGIDFLRNKGERSYRLLDSSLIFHGPLPHTGQTLRYEISIDRFIRQGDTTLFFFSYDCYADGKLLLQLRDACAGFFSPAELATPIGVVMTDKEKAERAALTRGYFKPLAYTSKTVLTGADLELLAQGKPGEVFGPDHAQDPGINPALRLPDAKLRMIDDVTVDRTGGPRGLGKLTATKRLQPDGWYFICHFPDDPVLAGSLVAEGAVQLLQIYLLYLGMHLTLPDARFQCMTDLRIDVQVRGQITQAHSEIRYEVEIMEVTLLPRPSVVADILIYLGDLPVIRMRNLGLQVLEKEGTPYRPEAGGIPEFLGRRNRNGEPAMINELHLAHAAKGLLDMAMGPEFEVYRTSRAPYIPNGDFQFVDRVMSLTGTRGDLNPGAEMITEYDSPPDAWYYQQNSYPHMPNAVYMESSLQAAIFLGYYLGATLKDTSEQYAIRNLDGYATLVKDIDLRGKTIRHHSKLLMTSSVSGAVLQDFSYELSADGEVFYTGKSLFGYFSEAALANQVGLDRGGYVPPWLETADVPASSVRRIELPDDAPAFTDPAGGYLHLPGGRYHLVDYVDFVEDGGKHGAGYLHGYRAVRPDEWYFECHFHRDPVMPGSLGVEAILQALRLYALEKNLAEGIDRPRFAMATGVQTDWKYRGQILRHDGELSFDVHIKSIQREQDRVLIIADADLSKPGLRIYEITDVAIEIRSAQD
jgi:PfaB family protein